MFKKRIIKHFLALFILVSIMTFGLFLFEKTFNNDVLISYGVSEKNISVTTEVEQTEKPNEVIELRNAYNNNDIQGKLVIEGTDISEPILKANDNSYYLNHNAYGAYQAEGSVYQDYRTKLGGKKILIFGHSSPGWSVPFNELEKYYDKSFYDNHKYIKIIGENEIYNYEIFSVYVETKDYTYMNLNIDEETYNSYLRKYQDRSFYDTKVKVNDNDNILILQTCSNKAEYANYKKKYLLVIAKEIRDVK